MNQEVHNEEQIVYHYQFDENQKQLITLPEQPKTSENIQKSYPDFSQYKTKQVTYSIDLEKEPTREIIDHWTNSIPNDQAVILFCLQTTSHDNRIDDAMTWIEEKIIPIFIDCGFLRDCMLKTVKLQQEKDHLKNDIIQITIFFSEHTLDSISSAMVDLDMKR